MKSNNMSLLKAFETFKLNSTSSKSIVGGFYDEDSYDDSEGDGGGDGGENDLLGPRPDMGSRYMFRKTTKTGLFFETVITDRDGNFSSTSSNIIGRTMNTFSWPKGDQ
jgi:hypothetical protein